MKKVLIGIFLLGMVGCEASEVVENEVNNIPLENLEDQQVENEEIEYSLESESLLKIKYPSTWYFYSFDGGAGSMMYFTDKGISEYKEELHNRSHDDLNFANECLLNIIWRIDNVDYKRKKLNTKIDPKEKEECENVLNELEKQIPEKNEKALEYLTHTQKIENELINYTSLDNCSNYYKDDINRKIYYVIGDMYREILEVIDADYNTFEVVSKCSIAKDKNNEYIDGEIVSASKLKKVEDENVKNEKEEDILKKENSENKKIKYSYYKGDSHVYFVSAYGEETIIEEADYDTFEALDDGYAKDKNHVYFSPYQEYLGKIEGADPKSLEKIKTNLYKDKNRVYDHGKIVEDANPNTFEVLNFIYSKDDKNIYWCNNLFCEKIPNVDYKSFEILYSEEIWAKDKNQVYIVYTLGDPVFNRQILENADPATFKLLDLGYAKDKNNIYFYSWNMGNLDQNSFQILEYPYSKDKNYVYKLYEKKEYYDSESFEILNYRYTKDKDNCYRYAQKVPMTECDNPTK